MLSLPAPPFRVSPPSRPSRKLAELDPVSVSPCGAADHPFDVRQDVVALVGLAVVGDTVETDGQGLCPLAEVDGVIAAAAADGVRALAAVERVVPVASSDRVEARAAIEVYLVLCAPVSAVSFPASPLAITKASSGGRPGG